MKCLLLLLVLFTTAAIAEPDKQPPQLLGVWYGTYQEPRPGKPVMAEMWLEISSQSSEDGWAIAGHNRWNVPAEPGEGIHGRDSLGRLAEHFDRVKGQVGRDGSSVVLNETTRGSRIDAVLTAPDTLSSDFYSKGSEKRLFSVELQRIDTHYDPTEVTVTGLDLSHHSGQVNWQKVKAQNYQFAYVKSSEGVDNADEMFETHWRALCKIGLAHGAYHFYVTEDDPVEQALFFASRIKDDPGTLPPAVDVELLGAHTTGDMTATLRVFLLTLESELGVKPIIYSSSRFWDTHYEPHFSSYHLWMAEYGVEMPRVPFGWNRWLIWQHAGSRAVDGVEKKADINLLHPEVQLESIMIGKTKSCH